MENGTKKKIKELVKEVQSPINRHSRKQRKEGRIRISKEIILKVLFVFVCLFTEMAH